MSFVRFNDAEPGFTDPACVQEIFVEEIGDIEIIAELLKITLVVCRRVSGQVERYVTCRIVVPLSNAKQMQSQVDAAIKGIPFMAAGIMPEAMAN